MIDYLAIIEKYTEGNPRLRHIIVGHSRAVASKALEIASSRRDLALDLEFVEEAAMLHDIGIVRVDAPSIFCFGREPYICHGVLGGEILRSEGLPRHARVAELHTGSGITVADIEAQKLPLPVRDYLPETLEEKLICYADKFFSKSRDLTAAKPLEKIEAQMLAHSPQAHARFIALRHLFAQP